MIKLVEFTTPEGPDFIAPNAIDRIRPAPEGMVEAGQPASLLYLSGYRGPVLVYGDAREITEELARLRHRESLANLVPSDRITFAAPARSTPMPAELAAMVAERLGAAPKRPTLREAAQRGVQKALAEAALARAEVARLRVQQAAQSGQAERT